MRGAHCKLIAFRPADNSPSRRHFHTRAPTLPMDTVYPISVEIARVYSCKSALLFHEKGSCKKREHDDHICFIANTPLIRAKSKTSNVYDVSQCGGAYCDENEYDGYDKHEQTRDP